MKSTLPPLDATREWIVYSRELLLELVRACKAPIHRQHLEQLEALLNDPGSEDENPFG